MNWLDLSMVITKLPSSLDFMFTYDERVYCQSFLSYSCSRASNSRSGATYQWRYSLQRETQRERRAVDVAALQLHMVLQCLPQYVHSRYPERIHNSAISSESLCRARLDRVVNSPNDAENQRPVFTFKSKLCHLKSIVYITCSAVFNLTNNKMLSYCFSMILTFKQRFFSPSVT